MALERIAALIWRFIGLALIVFSVPAVVSLSVTVVSSVGGRGGVALISNAGFIAFIATAQILIGATIIRFSDRLGMMIARGL